VEVLGKLNIRDRQGEGSYSFKALRICSLFTTATVSSVAVGKGESFSARVGGPMREGKKIGEPGTRSQSEFQYVNGGGQPSVLNTADA
jgi:hypothetical protein